MLSCSSFSKSAFAVVLLGVSTILVSGCENTAPLSASSRPNSEGAVSEPSFAQFSDVPVPTGAKMDLERSLVLGERDAWIGRLVMTVAANASRTYDFYFSEMPRFSWSPITTVRAGTSVLTYSRGNRVATIQISGRTLGGSDISMTISPKGSPAGPSSGVSSAPLR
jgi:hypothetical protein